MRGAARRAAVLCCGATAAARAPVDVVAEWVEVDYEWDSPGARAAAVASGAFKPENNAVTGVKVCGPEVAARCTRDTVFATVPRWRTGVWATLNAVTRNASGGAVLRPWPSRAAQVPGDCSAIQYVQSMEIDPEGVMWVVDVGRRYFADADPAAADNTCPPKMVLIDVPTQRVVDTYVFPSDVAPYDGAFLNDIVLDVPHQVAYLSSTGNNASDLGAVVVYDRKARRSRRFADETTRAPANGTDIVIHGVDRTALVRGFPTDGIALSPKLDILYYCALGGRHLFSIDATALRDFSTPTASLRPVEVGTKPSISDGMAAGADGALYFGGLTTDTLYRWGPSGGGDVSKAKPLITDADQLWWIDTFSFDNRGNIWLTSNKLDRYFFGGMDFSGKSGANFRIVKIPVGTDSYIKGEHAM